MSDLEQALADALAAKDEREALLAGARLAAARLEGGDLAGLAALLRHASLAVRHGAVEALDQASAAIEPAIGTLAEALIDNTGAVLYHGLQALKRAAAAGLDMTAAAGVLEQLFDQHRYETTGWTFGLDPGEQSDLHAERPSRDAAQAVAFHALARGDRETVGRLLEHEAATVAHGALKAVRSDERHADAARREQAARLLVPAYTKLEAWAGIEALVASADEATKRGARAGLADALAGPIGASARAKLDDLYDVGGR